MLTIALSIKRKQERIDSQKTLLSMFLESYNSFLNSSSINNASGKRVLKADKIEQQAI